MNNIKIGISDDDFCGQYKFNRIFNVSFFSVIFLLGGVKKLESPFDLYKFDCKTMIPNSEAFKLREALLRMNFKKRSCDLYSFSQSLDLNSISNNEKPIAVQQFLEVLGEIKGKISTYLGLTFNNLISSSCSKYDHGGKSFLYYL